MEFTFSPAVPISHGYTTESFVSTKDEFLSYPALAKVTIFVKHSDIYKQELWEGEVMLNNFIIIVEAQNIGIRSTVPCREAVGG